jgi:hypothetical protein
LRVRSPLRSLRARNCPRPPSVPPGILIPMEGIFDSIQCLSLSLLWRAVKPGLPLPPRRRGRGAPRGRHTRRRKPVDDAAHSIPSPAVTRLPGGVTGSPPDIRAGHCRGGGWGGGPPKTKPPPPPPPPPDHLKFGTREKLAICSLITLR